MAEVTSVLTRGTRIFAAAGVLLALHATLAPRSALAQAAPAATPPTQANLDEALVRYKRALDLFNDGSYDAALLEFRRAYELAPNYRVLYNIALVNVQLNDYAGALGAFEQYLAQGGGDIASARVDEVKREISRLSPRVATLNVSTDVPGADVSVDDLSIGKTPFDHPIRVNAGRRRVSVAAEGREPQARVVEAAGGDTLQLKFELSPPQEVPAPIAAPAPEPVAPTPEPSHVPWLAWSITGALAAGTTVSGVLALQAHSNQDSTKNRLGVTESDLDSANKKVEHLALATDILLGATALAGGISLYLTLRSPSHSSPTSDQAQLTIRPGSIAARIPF
jgi:hypothetical protein